MSLTIDDFVGKYKFKVKGNTNPEYYPPKTRMTISKSDTDPAKGVLKWHAKGQNLEIDAIPVVDDQLQGTHLPVQVGSQTYLVDVCIAISRNLALSTLSAAGDKTLTGAVSGRTAGQLVGQWGAESTGGPLPLEVVPGRPDLQQPSWP